MGAEEAPLPPTCLTCHVALTRHQNGCMEGLMEWEVATLGLVLLAAGWLLGRAPVWR